MKISLTKKDIIWSYIGTIMSMGANLIMLPFLMYYLDEDMLGLWYVFASVGAIATLFDFGFAVTFARNITYCWSGAKKLQREGVDFVENAEPDYYLMKQVLATCKIIYGIISAIALLILLTAGTFYIRYTAREIGGYHPTVSWVIYAVAVFLNLYFGYYSSFLRGVGAVDKANKNTVIARLVQILLTIVMLACGTGIIGASVAYLAYGTIFRLLGKHDFYRYKDIGAQLAQVKSEVAKTQIKALFSTVWHNAWRDGSISLCNYFCNQISTLICSIYLSLAETGVYSIGVQIASAIATIAGTLYSAYQPELQAAYINSDMSKMRKTMSLIVMSFVYLFFLGTAGFIVVGIPLLRLVEPETVVSVPVLLGLCAYQFILKFRNCYTSYFSCTNRIIYVRAFLVSAILCVALSFLFLGPFKYGVWGLIAGQILSQVVFNFWYWAMKTHKELDTTLGKVISMGTKEILETAKKFCGRKKIR